MPGETPEEGVKREYPQVDVRDGDEIRVGNSVFHVKVEAEVICTACGRVIPPAELGVLDGARVPGGPRLCGLCASIDPCVLTCVRCGKEFLHVVLRGQERPVLCPDCIEKAREDPRELLANLIRNAAAGTDKEVPKIAGYEVERSLGRGGFGAVYLAQHKKTGGTVALKIMLAKMASNERGKKLFLREIENGRKLRHPNIAGLMEHGISGGLFYFTMEYCEGGNLADLVVSRGGRVPLDVAAPIMLQALDGLSFAHRKGFVHRDLKPENVLLARADGGLVAKIADLGLSKSFIKAGLSGMTATGSFAGSLPYMPREQLTDFKNARPVSDVWSIGATFYVLLTGRLPRDAGPDQDPIEVVLRAEPVPVRHRDSSIPKRVAEVIDRALKSDVAQRYPTATEMRKALEAAL